MKMKTVKPGIRQKIETGKYLVTKSIKGQRFSREFDTLRDAINWKNTFVPGKVEIPSSEKTLKDVYEEYKTSGMNHLTTYTVYKKTQRMDKFLKNLFRFPMNQITRSVIRNHIETMKNLVEEDSRRCNFDKELKDLSSLFNWYHDEHEHFNNPITKKHFWQGKLKEVPKVQRDLSIAQVNKFLEKLKEPFKTMAKFQFLLGARIGEIAALNTSVVDFDTKVILIRDTIVWLKGAPKYKHSQTKTNIVAVKDLTHDMESMLKALNKLRPTEGLHQEFYFTYKNRLIRYNQILANYNKALKMAGLTQFSGTHIMRHSMATFARQKAGLDTAQKMLNHTSARQTERYARLDADQSVTSVVNMAEKLLKP